MDLKKLLTGVLELTSMLVIDTPDGPVRLGEMLNGFQRDFFAAISPALRQICGYEVGDCKQRFYEERPRGHSKSGDLAVVIVWLLIACKRKLYGVGAAADRDQARLLRDAVEGIIRLNPIFSQVLEVQAFKIINKHTGGVFEIISSDAASSFGLTPHLIVCDELSHWKSPDLWHSLLSSAAKRSECVVVCISNAGWKNSEWWRVREAIRVDPAWRFSRLDGCCASWISSEHLEEQRRLLPPAVYERLWENRWSDDGESAALRSDDIEAAVRLPGPTVRPEKGWIYVGGLDLGISHDASALVILGKHVGHTKAVQKPAPKLSSQARTMIDAGLCDGPRAQIDYRHFPGTGKLKLARVKVWHPEGGRVNLREVENEIVGCHQTFRLSMLSADPWQAELLLQRLQSSEQVPCDQCTFTGGNLQAMATATLDAFREKELSIFPHEQLVDDLRQLKIQERSYGFRLTSPKTDSGHGDLATALSIALRAARQIQGQSVLTSQRQLVFN